MISQRIVVKYPPRLIDKPILCNLTREFDLDFNILRAQVSPDSGGLMVIEITGESGRYEAAMRHLEKEGISTQMLSSDITWDEERCTQCGVCASLCPSGALVADPKTLRVTFLPEKCVACEYCVLICPVQAFQAYL